MDDLISRSWLLSEYDKRHKGPAGGARKLIEEAPSALGTNLAEVGTDLISRQAAIEAAYQGLQRPSNSDEWKRILEQINAIPSAQIEPLTYNEQSIFLAAMRRYEGREGPFEVDLVRICHEITRKVKGAIWTI